MSDQHPQITGIRTAQSRRGQAFVEFALVLPLLLVLLLGAIDFGRVFFGWVAVTNASRVAANYAATHPDAWANNNTDQKAEYKRLIADAGENNCAMYESSDPPPPTFPDGGREFGHRVRVDLSCEVGLVNPVLGPIAGPVTLHASSTFNVRKGCVDCASLPAPPPPPPQNHCRLVPNMVGQSVAGAKLKWTAAGFTGPVEPATADDSRTVSSQTVDQGGQLGCELPYAFFTSSVSVTLAAIVEPVPPETCRTVPNLLGMTVGDARAAWSGAGFETARLTTTATDEQIVSGVTYTPASVAHGQCVEPDSLDVEIGGSAPPPPPPPPPCKVPSFVNTPRSEAQETWDEAKFTGTITFQGGAWTTIGRQEPLVGGSYVSCTSSIKLFK